jgi:hypothetical protein
MARIAPTTSSGARTGSGRSVQNDGSNSSSQARQGNGLDFLDISEGMTVPILHREDRDSRSDAAAAAAAAAVSSPSLRLLASHDSDHGCYDSESSDDSENNSSDDEGEELENTKEHDDADPGCQRSRNSETTKTTTTHVSREGDDSRCRKNGKRPATPISSPASLKLQGCSNKKFRQSVGVSQTPSEPNKHPSLSQEPQLASQSESTIESYQPTLQAVAPTLQGIQELVQHLRRHPSLQHRTGKLDVVHEGIPSNSTQRRTSMAALPTECTYEVCSLVSWSKNESLNEEDNAFRIRQLDHCKFHGLNFLWRCFR